MLKLSFYSPAVGYLCYFKFAHSSTQTIYLSLYRYLFEGCYFWNVWRRVVGNVLNNISLSTIFEAVLLLTRFHRNIVRLLMSAASTNGFICHPLCSL